MYQNRMLNSYFYFLQFLLKIQKSVKDKSSGNNQNLQISVVRIHKCNFHYAKAPVR